MKANFLSMKLAALTLHQDLACCQGLDFSFHSPSIFSY